jgi:hypothetical protein
LVCGRTLNFGFAGASEKNDLSRKFSLGTTINLSPNSFRSQASWALLSKCVDRALLFVKVPEAPESTVTRREGSSCGRCGISGRLCCCGQSVAGAPCGAGAYTANLACGAEQGTSVDEMSAVLKTNGIGSTLNLHLSWMIGVARRLSC